MSVPAYALFVTDRLANGLTKADTDVFHRVVLIDFKIAIGANLEVEQSVAGQQIQHVIKETDSRLNVALARTIQIQLEFDLSFFGSTLNAGGAHHGINAFRGDLQRS